MNPFGFHNYYLIGIGGAGMSSLAKFLVEAGKKVYGSDIENSYKTDKLVNTGIRIIFTQDSLPDNIDIDCLVYSSAIPQDNGQLKQATKMGISSFKYTKFIGEISKKYETIAVCGTHGKTTTTALLSHILENAGFDPSYIIGEEMINNKRASRFGNGKYMIIESCEFGKNFYDIHPRHIILTNIEEEHPDTYSNLDEVIESFTKFLYKCANKQSRIFINSSDLNCDRIIQDHNLPYETIALDNKYDWSIARSNGHLRVYKNKKYHGKFVSSLKGSHNYTNILLAIACANYIGVPRNVIRESLKSFPGTRRRFELIKKSPEYEVYDDYAHHPTQVKVVLKTAKELFPKSKIVAVFQPHQFKRTDRFFDEYSLSFNDCNLVVISPLYLARDSNVDYNILQRLSKAINNNGTNSIVTGNLEETTKTVKKQISKHTVVITLGAGDIYKVAKEL